MPRNRYKPGFLTYFGEARACLSALTREHRRTVPEFADPTPPSPRLTLGPSQQQVLDALRRREQPKYPLGDWYLGALWALAEVNNPERFAQAAHSLRELMEKLPNVVQGAGATKKPQFHERRTTIRSGLMAEDKAYPKCTWLKQVMTPGLAETLDHTVDYLELSLTYSRSARITDAIKALDPLFAAPSRKIAADKTARYQRIWDNLEDVTHHQAKPTDMKPLLEELDNLILDLVAPVVTDDQAEILELLRQGPTTPAAAPRMLQLIDRRGANYLLFFQRVNDPAWLDPLVAGKRYEQLPEAITHPNGGVTYEYWWPMAPLPRMADKAEDKVISLILTLPKTDNPRILQEVTAVALAAPTLAQSLRLKGLVLEYINLPVAWLAHDGCTKLIKKWSVAGDATGLKASLTVATALLNLKDPGKGPEQGRRLSMTRFQPPREMWEFREVAERGLQPLIDTIPMAVAKMLCGKLQNIFKLEFDSEETVPWEDGSDWWCAGLMHPDAQESDPRCVLAVALTRAALAVVAKDPSALPDLREVLRKQPGQLFDRILWTVYVQSAVTPQTDFAAEIIAGRGYGLDNYEFEFQQLITTAFSRFGPAFLTEAEREQIFAKIRSGPDKQAYIEIRGEEVASQYWEKAQRGFHLLQLAPFAPGLFGEHQSYFAELSDQGRKVPTGADYFHGGGARGGVVEQRSPRTAEDLAALNDADLIAFLNQWNESGRDERDFLIQISFRGLARTFGALIETSPERFARWHKEWEQITRPVYLAAALEIAGKLVKDGKTDQLQTWFEVCDLVVRQTATAHDNGHEGSAEKPNWNSARRAAVDFLDLAVDPKQKPIDPKWSGRVWPLIVALATGADPDLENDAGSKRETISTAINRTRSRALETVLEIADWAKKPALMHQLLEQRFAGVPPLTLPERALLAMNFPRIYLLDAAWAKAHVKDLFPRDDYSQWVAIFGAYLLNSRAFTDLYPLVEGEFNHALVDLKVFETDRHDRDAQMVDRMGDHLFMYYVQGLFPATGDKSHLKRFLEQVPAGVRGHLFHHVGGLLNNSAPPLPDKIWTRVQVYFKERLAKRDSLELTHFALWLKAKCLPVKWRLTSFLALLDQAPEKEISVFGEVETLAELRKEELGLAVECFMKMTGLIPAIPHFYIKEEDAKALIKDGLASADPIIVQNAKKARENLLANGQSGYMELG